METNFNFKSQIATDKNQSERLLALGLKKETADCCYYYHDGEYLIAFAEDAKYPSDIPAWSLHRLIEIVAHTQYPYYVISKELPIYDALCERIEWLIKEGYFNKEYLCEK
jgi:hypothetical protein